jgi:hypothetical protein
MDPPSKRMVGTKSEKNKYPRIRPIYRYLDIHSNSKMVLAFSTFFVLLYLFASSTFLGTAADGTKLSSEQLLNLLNDVRGDDERLMRWHAKSYTRKRQHEGGCDDLPKALDVILDYGRSAATTTTTRPSSQKTIDVTNAMEYTTFCVTDNPQNRAIFSQHDGSMHKAIVDLLVPPTVDNDDDGNNMKSASAVAAHVIYIASFANAENQQGFFQAGAVKSLSEVILNESSSPLQTMWACAALQNMLASYCDTEGNGRCSWKWVDGWERDASNPPQLVVSKKMTVVSDGQPIREVVRDDKALISRLVDLASRGPVKGKMSNENPYVGDNAKAGIHDNSPNIVAWAAGENKTSWVFVFFLWLEYYTMSFAKPIPFWDLLFVCCNSWSHQEFGT